MDNLLQAKLKEARTNSSIRKLYAKSKCKWCKGKGLLTYKNTNGFERSMLCDCVTKSINKEIKRFNDKTKLG